MKNLSHFIWISVKKYKIRFFFLTILIASWSLENSFIPYVLGKVVDSFAICSDKSKAWEVVGCNLLIYFGLWFFVHLCCRVGGFVRASLIPDFSADLRMRAFEEVSKKSYQYFVGRLSGDVSSKIYILQEKITKLISIFIHGFLPGGISLFFALYLFCSVKIEIAIAVFFCLFLHIFICVVMGKKCSLYEKEHSAISNFLNGCVVDCISNNFIWKIFSNEKHEYKYINKHQENEVIKAKKTQTHIVKLHTVLSGLSVFLNVCGINLLGYFYWQSGEISLAEFVFIINAMLSLEMLAWQIGLELPELFTDIGAIKQAFSVISEDSYVRDIPNAKKLNLHRGKIDFENISFGYGEKLLFDNLSVSISPLEKIGLVGKSGSGKSSFVNLLLRLYDIKSGKISIDGQDISRVTQESLRENMAVVPQDPTLFHRKILDNLKYGNLNATENQIQEALELADIEDIIKEKGWEYDVGESGKKLSKGQKQRIAIARAFLKSGSILILDEVTSALDAISEGTVQKSLNTIMKNKTVIAIAHRLSTLKKMDRIFVFDKGKIVEIGTHDELIDMKGIYCELWETQKEGFI